MRVVPVSLLCSEKEVHIKFAGLLLEGFCFIVESNKQKGKLWISIERHRFEALDWVSDDKGVGGRGESGDRGKWTLSYVHSVSKVN